MTSRSVCARMATLNARRTCIPEEKFLSFCSAKSSSSANANTSSILSRSCARVSPRTAPPRNMFSRAVSSGLNPTPSSRNAENSPFTRAYPEVGFVDPAEDLEQGALAASVGPRDAEELTGGDVERDVSQRDEVAITRRAAPVRDAILERGALVERKAESLAEVGDLDDRAHSNSANFGVSLLKTRNPTTNTATLRMMGITTSAPIYVAMDWFSGLDTTNE